MSLSSPGSSSFVQLVPEKKKRNINLCIICQCKKDVKGSTKLTSTPEGRNHIILTSRTLQDEFLFGLTDADLFNIRYHVKSRFAKYKRSGERFTETPTLNKREASPESAPFGPKSRLKRVKTTVNVREKPCIFLNQFKYQSNTKRYRTSEVNVAKTLLKAAKFNKNNVHTQCILLKNVGDVFAADVMYHSNCLNKYFKKFRYDVDSLMAFEIEDDKDRLEDTFKELITSMDINKHGYVLSDVRDLMNEKLKEEETGENKFSSCFVLL